MMMIMIMIIIMTTTTRMRRRKEEEEELPVVDYGVIVIIGQMSVRVQPVQRSR